MHRQAETPAATMIEQESMKLRKSSHPPGFPASKFLPCISPAPPKTIAEADVLDRNSICPAALSRIALEFRRPQTS
jgi:hypothetical protein